MMPTPSVLARALDRARTEWLAGDPAAWARYTACLAHLEAHRREIAAELPRAASLGRPPSRAPRGVA